MGNKNWQKLLIGIILVGAIGCSKEETLKQTKVVKEEKGATSEKAQKDDAKETKVTPLTRNVDLWKRDIPLIDDNQGRIVFLGEKVDDKNKLHVAFRLEGGYQNTAKHGMQFRLILDNGLDVIVKESDLMEERWDDKGLILIYEIEHQDGVGKAMRLDYAMQETADGEFDEEHMKMVKLEEPKDSDVISGTLPLKETVLKVNMKAEDDEKVVDIANITVSVDAPNTIEINGTITYKKDKEAEIKVRAIRPFAGERIGEKRAKLLNARSNKFYAEVPVQFSQNLEYKSVFGDNKGSIVYISIDNALFMVDLRTGKTSEEPVSLMDLPVGEGAEYVDMVTAKGIQDVSGNRYLNAVSSSSPYWNYGVGTTERATYEFILGGHFETLKFQLGSGESLKDKGANYDVYLYGDDFESVRDSDEVKGNPIFQQKMTGMTPTKEYEVNVKGIKTLTLYYNSNLKSEMLGNKEKNGEMQIIMGNGSLE